MSTFYDFISVALFVATVLLFLHYSKDADQKLTPYLGAAIGCAIANFVGNEGYDIAGLVLLALTAGYIYFEIYKRGGVPDPVDDFDDL